MNPIRVAILIAFVGASLWALAHFLLGRPYWITLPQAATSPDFLAAEVIIITLAAVAWVLAGMVKSKV